MIQAQSKSQTVLSIERPPRSSVRTSTSCLSWASPSAGSTSWASLKPSFRNPEGTTMMLDALLNLSSAQAVTATAVSTNSIDLSTARDVGVGNDLYASLWC